MVKEELELVKGGTECILFADDTVLLAEGQRTLNGMMWDFDRTCQDFGTKINVKKTKRMVIEKMEQDCTD